MALTKISNNSLSAISSLPASIPTGALTLISTQTASSSASIEFTSGIDSTYDSYVFKFIDIHPSVEAYFQFQGSTDGGSNYGVTMTTTNFRAIHDESDTTTSLSYRSSSDLAQSTSFQYINEAVGNDADSNLVGYLQIFNPSSSVFVKHWIARSQCMLINTYSSEQYQAGYFNTTSTINALKFAISTGTFDGIIKMYGVS